MGLKKKIKVSCKNCGAEGKMNRPFGMNKYLSEMIYSRCQECLGDKKK